MDIKYKNTKIEKLCNTIRIATREFGKDNAKKLSKRINEITQSVSIGALERDVRASKPHFLMGSRKGEIAIVVKKGLRIITEPNMNKDEYTKDGNTNFYKITKLLIKNVEDYHDEKD